MNSYLMHIYKLDYTNTFIDLKNNNLDKNIFKLDDNYMKKYNFKQNKSLNYSQKSYFRKNY